MTEVELPHLDLKITSRRIFKHFTNISVKSQQEKQIFEWMETLKMSLKRS